MKAKFTIATILILASAILCRADEADSDHAKQITNAAPQNVKAYKTLNFGDDIETVKSKLAEIVIGAEKPTQGYGLIYPKDYISQFWRLLFDSDIEYEPYKCPENWTTEQSEKFRSLKDYFTRFKVSSLNCKNDVIKVRCFQLFRDIYSDAKPGEEEGLACVEVTYLDYDPEKLIANFVQSYPNARRESKHYKTELLPAYPGAFIEFDRTVFFDNSQDTRAMLSIQIGKPTTIFTEQSKLSASEKSALLKEIANAKPNAPYVAIASKQILDVHMNTYRQSIEDEVQAKKAQLKKAKEAADGF